MPLQPFISFLPFYGIDMSILPNQKEMNTHQRQPQRERRAIVQIKTRAPKPIASSWRMHPPARAQALVSEDGLVLGPRWPSWGHLFAMNNLPVLAGVPLPPSMIPHTYAEGSVGQCRFPLGICFQTVETNYSQGMDAASRE